jgi:hypothetical protein
MFLQQRVFKSWPVVLWHCVVLEMDINVLEAHAAPIFREEET